MDATPTWRALELLPQILCVGVAAVSAATDVWRSRIYNAVTYSGIVAGLVAQSCVGHGVVYALLGLAVGAVPMLLLFALGGVSGGDVKLFAVLGVCLGPQRLLYLFPVAFGFALFFTLAKLAWQGRLFCTLWSAARFSRPGSEPLTLPFALPVLVGTLAVLFDLDHLLTLGGRS